MKRIIPFLSVLLCLMLCSYPACADRESVRAAYAALSARPEAVYEQEPVLTQPVRPGSLSDAAVSGAVEYLNFLRALAGLPPVTSDGIYDLYSQHAAVLCILNGCGSHEPERPAFLDGDFYLTGLTGCSRGNIAYFNWTDANLLRKAVMYLVRDDGDGNLSRLAHRRWCLSPLMGRTGFGCAQSDTDSCVVMYAVDESAGCDIPYVLWPSAGSFPADLISDETAWSCTLCGGYSPTDHVSVRMHEVTEGLDYVFDCTGECSDGFSCVALDDTGKGPCVIFRPVLSVPYRQNQVWQVTISGLTGAEGKDAEITYTVEMISLWPIDVTNVEFDAASVTMKAGEKRYVTARAVPAYADDISLTYSTDDETVAIADDNGCVSALGPGECVLTASSSNSVTDTCVITVGP